MKTEIQPELKVGEKRVVFITHDETTCYCCEGKRLMWMENGKKKILPKTKGTSVMISGFTCKCHGFMSLNGVKSYQLFEAGTAREGWFTNAHLVKQVEDYTELFKALHPECDIVIAFDNSMTHHAKAPEGLCVSNLNLSDGLKKGVDTKMKAGWYKNEVGVIVQQSMQREDGTQKGVETILTERGKFRDENGKKLKLLCGQCKKKVKSETEKKGCWDKGERYIHI
jgi:hypothetical protein